MQREISRSIGLVMSCLAGLGFTAGLVAQDFSVLRINEVITDNETTGPADSTGFVGHDMVEIFNSGDVPLTLGSSFFADRLALSDTETQPPLGLWTFPAAPTNTVIPPKGFLVRCRVPTPRRMSWGYVYRRSALDPTARARRLP